MTDFDKIIHEPARLRILTLLVNGDDGPLSFKEIKEALGMTAGNLSVQLRKLQSAGYASITKEFKDNKPLTTVDITPAGGIALMDYIAQMEAVIKSLKKNT